MVSVGAKGEKPEGRGTNRTLQLQVGRRQLQHGFRCDRGACDAAHGQHAAVVHPHKRIPRRHRHLIRQRLQGLKVLNASGALQGQGDVHRQLVHQCIQGLKGDDHDAGRA